MYSEYLEGGPPLFSIITSAFGAQGVMQLPLLLYLHPRMQPPRHGLYSTPMIQVLACPALLNCTSGKGLLQSRAFGFAYSNFVYKDNSDI